MIFFLILCLIPSFWVVYIDLKIACVDSWRYTKKAGMKNVVYISVNIHMSYNIFIDQYFTSDKLQLKHFLVKKRPMIMAVTILKNLTD